MLEYDDFVIAAILEEGRLSPEQVETARRHAAQHHVPVTEAVATLGLITGRELAIFRATISECPFVDLEHFEIDIRNARRLPRSVAEHAVGFPLFDLDGVVTVGMADPLDLRACDQMRSHLKADVDPVLCEPEALRALIGRAYSLGGAGRDEGTDPGRHADLTTGDEPIVAAVNQIITQAIDEGASDIHIGPDERELHLRFRVDGALRARQGPPLAAHAGVVQRLKVMAHLDLTQSRRPQDGKFRFSRAGRTVDVRLSTIPTVWGENVVMRLLACGGSIHGFVELGLPESVIERFEEMIAQPHGMVLVTGPTGSGKTTTLYTALKRLNSVDRNIMTIEDPVEIRLPLIRQVQVNAEIGMTFAGALRSILRQDPDVVLVGEIRDEETAHIATQAALTGHLVLSTLHTNDAAGAIARLRDFGCAPFAINAAVLGSMAQRLVRRVCQDCAAPSRPERGLLRRFGLADDEPGFVAGAGCSMCSNTGYRGRLGVYELLRLTPPVRDLIEQAAATDALRRRAIEDGMEQMWVDGLAKARQGQTTLAEVARAVAVEGADSGSTTPASDARRAAA